MFKPSILLSICLSCVILVSETWSLMHIYPNNKNLQLSSMPSAYLNQKFRPYGVVSPLDNTLKDLVDLPSQVKASSAVKYSDSSGAAIQLSKVSVAIGNNDILNDVNWMVLPNERWAIVGRNGEGKSTLLKAITNTGGDIVSIPEGDIIISKKARIGYLEQKGVSGSTKTVREEVSSRMERLVLATKMLEETENAVANGDISDDMMNKLTEATIEFEAAGGYNVEMKISTVLKGLGFIEDDFDRKCSEFSGGWGMRIALGRLLLSEPDLLILDEPTNHLDIGAKDWLGGYLSRYDGTLLLVSHDENLLKVAVTSIAEVRQGKVELYKSRTYEQWQIEREERVQALQSKYEANQREIARLQTFVDRFGAKTMGASLAQSKLKTIEKIEDSMSEPIITDSVAPKLKLPPPPRGSEKLLELSHADIGWPMKNGETSKPLLKDVCLRIERGKRIAIRGPNGAGKSTLFKALAGKIPLTLGSLIPGDGLDLGYFAQDLAQELDTSMSAVDCVCSLVRAKNPTISDEKARNVLGSLGLIKAKGTRLVGHLSGGEKARVALASFVLLPHNLLLLDEPSNHLDVATIDVLTKALKEFQGTSVVISHDKTFLTEFDPTHVISIRDGKVIMEERGLLEEDWDDVLNSREASKYVSSPSPSSTSNVESSRKGISSKQISKIESYISKYEKEVAMIDEEMMNNGRNSAKLSELQKKKDVICKKIEDLYADYAKLEAN